jgi:hypothetical protein
MNRPTILAASVICAVFTLHSAETTPVTQAVAVLHPTARQHCQGVVRFTQEGESVKVVAEIEGLTPGQMHRAGSH